MVRKWWHEHFQSFFVHIFHFLFLFVCFLSCSGRHLIHTHVLYGHVYVCLNWNCSSLLTATQTKDLVRTTYVLLLCLWRSHTHLMEVLNRQVKCQPSAKQRPNKCVWNRYKKHIEWTDGRQFIRLVLDLPFIMNLRDFTICWHVQRHIVTSFIRIKIME